eukprot:3699677-Rhodomonas_salina.1
MSGEMALPPLVQQCSPIAAGLPACGPLFRIGPLGLYRYPGRGVGTVTLRTLGQPPEFSSI